MLNGRALVTAAGAPRPLPQHVARRGGGPADEGDRACQRRVMLAALAVKTQPRRRAVQVADRGGRGASSWAVIDARLPVVCRGQNVAP